MSVKLLIEFCPWSTAFYSKKIRSKANNTRGKLSEKSRRKSNRVKKKEKKINVENDY